MAEPAPKLQQLLFEDCKIRFRNFSGEAGVYNAKGQRNFTLLLDDDAAEAMAKDGWNVKWLEPKREDDERQAILKVKVQYETKEGKKTRPPNVVLVTTRGKTPLDESMVNILDYAEIVKVDLIIRPYEWNVNDKKGVTAYLKSIYVTIHEDELEQKYADVPDSAVRSLAVHDDVPEKPPWEA